MQNGFEKRIQRINARKGTPPPLPSTASKGPPPLPASKRKSSKTVFIGIAVTAVLVVSIGSTGMAFYSGVQNLLGADPKVSMARFLSSEGPNALSSKIARNAKMAHILNRYESGKITKEEAVRMLTDAGIELR